MADDEMDDMFAALTVASRPIITKKPWMDGKRLVLVRSVEVLARVVDECIASKLYALDLETTGLDNRVFDGRTVDKIVGICISPDGETGYYVPVRHVLPSGEFHEACLAPRLVEPEIRRLTSAPAVAIFHNGKFDHEFLQFNGGASMGEWDDPRQWEDTLILAYLRNTRERNKGLKHLSKQELGMEMIELDELFTEEELERHGKNFSVLDPTWDPAIWYACSDAICTYLLYKKIRDQAIVPVGDMPSQEAVYTMEKLCVAATRWAERCRIPIDREKVKELIRVGQREWLPALGEVYQAASAALGRDITPGYFKLLMDQDRSSRFRFDPEDADRGLAHTIETARDEALRRSMDPVEVAEGKSRIKTLQKRVSHLTEAKQTEVVDFPLIYDVTIPEEIGLLLRELGVKGLNVTEKSGQIKTSKDELDRVIEDAGDQFPFIPKVKRFREVAKAIASNLLPILEDTSPERSPDGRIRVNYEAFRVDTGRFSTPQPKGTFHGTCRWNLHSIPATYDTKKPQCMLRIRECIRAALGFKLAAVDFSGQELRVAANLSGEPLWIREFFRCADCGLEFDQGGVTPPPPEPPPPFCPNCGSDKIGDLHTLTALSVYGEESKDDADFKHKRQGAKCVHPDTLVQTPQGRVRMGDLTYGEEGKFLAVRGMKVHNGERLVRVKETYNGGSKSLHHVVTRNGVLTCSAAHQFALADGTLRSLDAGLAVGDVLFPAKGDVDGDREYPSVRYTPFHGVPALSYQTNAATAYFAGLHVGDGTSSESSAGISHGSISKTDTLGTPYVRWQEILMDACRAVGLDPQGKEEQVYLGSRHVLRWMEALGLVAGDPPTHRTLRVPSWVREAGREAMLHFLGGLMDTDGWIGKHGDGGVCTKDWVFAGQLAELFRAVGCEPAVHPSWNKTYDRWYAKVMIKRRDGKRLAPYMRHPGKLARIVDTEVAYDRTVNEVLLILPAGEGPCVDVHLDSEDHLYLTNGLTTHNSLNFAMAYGGGPSAAQRAVGCSRDEAMRIKKQFDGTYKGLAGWWRYQHDFARRNKHVLTPFGRRYPLPDIDHADGGFRSKAERNATNGPIQGGGGDLMKLSMGLIYRECKKRGWFNRVKMIITIHDELVFEIEDALLAEALPVIKDIMLKRSTAKLNWRVPLTCDIEIGYDWTVPWNYTKILYGKKPVPTELATVFEGVKILGGKKADGMKVEAPPRAEAPVPTTPGAPPSPAKEPPSETPTGTSATPPPSNGTSHLASAPMHTTTTATIVPPSSGQPYVHVIHSGDLSMTRMYRVASLIRRCAGRGVNPLRLVTDTGAVLWDDPKVLISPNMFATLLATPDA